jgi:hypothetical protein
MSTARRLFLGLGLAALSAANLPAQQREIEAGFVGGINHNTMTGVGPVDARVAGQAGLYGQFRLGRSVAFRPEVTVSWKRVGTSQVFEYPPYPPCDPGPCPLSRSSASAGLEATTSMTWLEVPLLAQVSLGTLGGGNIVPRFIAGPYVAVRLSCSVSTSGNVIYDMPAGVEPPGPLVTYSQSCGDATGQSYGNGDAGYVLGAGLGTRRFGVGIRWTRSLVATVPFSAFGASPLTGGKQSTLALTLDVAIQ